jgi:hypothetical protein
VISLKKLAEQLRCKKDAGDAQLQNVSAFSQVGAAAAGQVTETANNQAINHNAAQGIL